MAFFLDMLRYFIPPRQKESPELVFFYGEGSSTPRDGAHGDVDIRLNELMDGADFDEGVFPADHTADTLSAMRQERAHSLDHDLNDPFFWRDARPDAVAGMAKMYLKARCPTPYWRSLVSSNPYALWGAVALARAQAMSRGDLCGLAHLGACAFSSLTAQGALLAQFPPATAQGLSDLARADGLPLPGLFLGDIHKHAALRALFAAMALGRPIEWPDLPPRLGPQARVPERLPALSIRLDSLAAELVMVDAGEAESFWARSLGRAPEQGPAELLMAPDWASWMLSPEPSLSFSKWGLSAKSP